MEWRHKLSDNMDTYYQATNIAVMLLSPEGEVLESFGETYSYCKLFQEGCGKYCPCQKSHLHACKEAARLMDGYIFACPAGYIHFAVPVYWNRTLRASILAGPISLEYPDIALIDGIIQKFNLDIGYRAKLYGAYAGAPLVEPHRARYLCKLLTELAIIPASAEDNTFIRKQIEQGIQQARIGEYIQLIKHDGQIVTSQYNQEKQLIADVLVGNKPHAKALLNEMLGRIYFTSGNNFEIIRTRTIELLALLSRAIAENGGGQAEVYQMTEEALHSIVAAKDLTELSYTLLEILDMFIERAFCEQKVPDSPSLQKAVSYVNEHYFEPINLEDIAGYVGLNPTYFSAMFKKQMQVSFSEYLTERRITQAKVLLKNSNMPIVEISIAVGFENQSYFSKVFKKHLGMTPKQFRDSSN